MIVVMCKQARHRNHQRNQHGKREYLAGIHFRSIELLVGIIQKMVFEWIFCFALFPLLLNEGDSVLRVAAYLKKYS